MTEGDIIDGIQGRLRRMGIAEGNGIVTGIGDDCAVFRPRGSKNDLVFTADMMHEGVHFLLSESAEIVGYKALARSLSDCAAMGARPLFCLLSLSFPAAAAAEWVKGFYAGFTGLAKKHGVVLAGGDLSRTGAIGCDVTVCGELPRGTAMLRSNARLGDRICVSGRLGKAAAALATGGRYLPRPRLALGRKLREGGVKCAMDLSDGLSTDLARLCLASACAAELDRVPAAKGATPDQALHGGEDYELVYTLPAKRAAPRGTYVIGRIVEGPPGLIHYHGQPLQPQGWDHFRPQ